MHRFIFAYCCCAAVLAGCRKADNRVSAGTSTTTAGGAVAPPAAPAALSLADVAGKWMVRAVTEAGDSTILTYVLSATPSPSGWTITFANRPPMAVRIAASGDSVVTDAGPYSSVLRKGVQVTMHTVSRLQGGKLVGTGAWHYATSKPDSVLRFHTEGTRAP